jgi:sulfatase maturation enzyme AslB (radical SAM superfamily)
MLGPKIFPIKNVMEIQTMTADCYACPAFEICNGCKKTIKDHKDYNLTEVHCKKMKTLIGDIIDANS